MKIFTKQKLSWSNPKSSNANSQPTPKKKKVYDVDTKLQDKPLYLTMQKKFFEMIECGNKIEEYRDKSDFYKSRLCNIDRKTLQIISIKNYKTVILQEGYKSNARRMLIEVEKITLDRIFTIHLGEILERINF